MAHCARSVRVSKSFEDKKSGHAMSHHYHARCLFAVAMVRQSLRPGCACILALNDPTARHEPPCARIFALNDPTRSLMPPQHAAPAHTTRLQPTARTWCFTAGSELSGFEALTAQEQEAVAAYIAEGLAIKAEGVSAPRADSAGGWRAAPCGPASRPAHCVASTRTGELVASL